LDTIEIKQELVLPTPGENSASITVDFANAIGAITGALKGMLKDFLLGKHTVLCFA